MSLFSILVANYNNAAYLPEAIRSCLEQTYSDLEILILDDASTDGSVALIRELAAKDTRIRFLLHDRNRGIGYSKRELVAASRGTVFGFLDPDDLLHPDAVWVMMEAHGALADTGLIYSTLIRIDPNGVALGTGHYNKAIPSGESFLTYGGIAHFVSIKRSLYDRTEGINPLLRIAEDQDLYMKMEEVAAVHFIDRPLYYYRDHSGAISLNRNVTRAHVWQVIARYEAFKRRGIEVDEGLLIGYFERREQRYLSFRQEMDRPGQALKQFLRTLKRSWTQP